MIIIIFLDVLTKITSRKIKNFTLLMNSPSTVFLRTYGKSHILKMLSSKTMIQMRKGK